MTGNFCGSCGAPVTEGSSFCGSCGAPRASAAQTATPQPPAPAPGPPPAPQYAAAPVGYVRAVPTNGFAIAALICSLVAGCGVGSILGIVFGYIARRQIAERGERGSGMALAGIIIGWIGLAIGLLWLLILVIAAASSNGSNY